MSQLTRTRRTTMGISLVVTLAMTGVGTANLGFGSGALGGGRSGAFQASLVSDDLRWTRKGGDRVAASLRATATGERFDVGGLTLEKLVLAGQGPLAADASGVRLAIAASALGHGRWDGLGAPGKDDGAQLIAIKRAVRGFRFAAPKVALVYGPKPSVRLAQPIVVRPDKGGELRLTMSGADAVQVSMAGGEAPTVSQISNTSLASFADAYREVDLDANDYYSANTAKSMLVVQVQKGKPVVVYPPDGAEGKFIYPMP